MKNLIFRKLLIKQRPKMAEKWVKMNFPEHGVNRKVVGNVVVANGCASLLFKCWAKLLKLCTSLLFKCGAKLLKLCESLLF